MPAYSFQPRFYEPILIGTKGGTIRAPRRSGNVRGYGRSMIRTEQVGGHAYPGEELALYVRQRHPTGFLIDRKACVAVEPILLDIGRGGRIFLKSSSLVLCMPDRLDAFARFDGFEDFTALAEFWRATHNSRQAPDGPGVFDGWHIRWAPLPEEVTNGK
jgi:hypothetical protein